MPVQAIFFDLDDTLVDDAASFRIAAARACADVDTGIKASVLAESYVSLSEAFWAKQSYVGSNFGDVRIELWRSALRACGCEDGSLALRIIELYSAYRMDICEVYDETRAVLEALSGTHALGVITNGHGETQRNRLRVTGLDRYFDLIVAATDIDAGKPDPAIFNHALQGLGLDAASTWHVGDRLDSDVLGALNTGLTAVWLNRHGAPRDPTHPTPHHEITSLADLPGLLP